MSEQAIMISKYGEVSVDDKIQQQKWAAKNMMIYDLSHDFPELPIKKIYCNKAIVGPLHQALLNLQQRGLIHEIKTYGGCWVPRYIRGYEIQKILSIHSWGCAIDFNVDQNPLGKSKTDCINVGLTPFTIQFDQAWKDAGWECGSGFPRKDGMHFEYTR